MHVTITYNIINRKGKKAVTCTPDFRVATGTLIRLAGWTQRSVCNAAGVQQSNLSAWLKNKCDISIQKLDSLLAELNVSNGSLRPNLIHRWMTPDGTEIGQVLNQFLEPAQRAAVEVFSVMEPATNVVGCSIISCNKYRQQIVVLVQPNFKTQEWTPVSCDALGFGTDRGPLQVPVPIEKLETFSFNDVAALLAQNTKKKPNLLDPLIDDSEMERILRSLNEAFQKAGAKSEEERLIFLRAVAERASFIRRTAELGISEDALMEKIQGMR